MIRVVLAEDHYLVREGTRKLLESYEEVEVVAAVDDPESLREAVDRLLPDAVVTDIRMPPSHQTEGITAALDLRERHPDIGIVVLSQYANSRYALELFRDGTAGMAYLLKHRIGDVDELLHALRQVTSGESVVDPQVVDGLLMRRQRLAASPLDTLTEREKEVLGAMAEGKTNAAIAETLFVSLSAVEKYINTIFAKLGLSPEDKATHRRVAAVLTFLREYRSSDRF
jgi:DNA-binding NarL/FixJ family response regulator